MGSKQKQGKKKKWLRIIGLVVLFLIIGIGAYAYSVYHSLTSAVDTMHKPIERKGSEKRTEEVTLEKKDPFSVLMLGVDEREGDKGRSDTIIVLTVNPNKNSIKMLSIPRDTRTEIIGHNTVDKINHAYAFGGEEMSMNTVEHFLDIPIDYYVKINMEGFKDIVNAVGGITINNPFAFSDYGYDFKKGNITLDGDEALVFVRMRKQDPSGDYGRQQRQRLVIQGVIDKGASFSSLTRFNNIFGALGKNVKTNLTFDEMIDIQKNYKDTRHNLEQIQMEGEGKYINSISYQIISEEEQKRVQDELKAHLELDASAGTTGIPSS